MKDLLARVFDYAFYAIVASVSGALSALGLLGKRIKVLEEKQKMYDALLTKISDTSEKSLKESQEAKLIATETEGQVKLLKEELLHELHEVVRNQSNLVKEITTLKNSVMESIADSQKNERLNQNIEKLLILLENENR